MMKFLPYFSVVGFSNSYLLGPDKGGDAVLIDPGIFDEGLLTLIEGNKLYVRNVLITHAHRSHINGIKTLCRIYEVNIFCFNPRLLDFDPDRIDRIKGGMELNFGDISFNVIETPGHSNDSLSFKTDNLLFTGDTLSAGSVGETGSNHERSLLLASIQKEILTLGDDTLIFPGHGPPTTVALEKKFNSYLKM